MISKMVVIAACSNNRIYHMLAKSNQSTQSKLLSKCSDYGMLFSEKIANQLLIQSKKKETKRKGDGRTKMRKMTLFKAVLRGKCSITT